MFPPALVLHLLSLFNPRAVFWRPPSGLSFPYGSCLLAGPQVCNYARSLPSPLASVRFLLPALPSATRLRLSADLFGLSPFALCCFMLPGRSFDQPRFGLLLCVSLTPPLSLFVSGPASGVLGLRRLPLVSYGSWHPTSTFACVAGVSGILVLPLALHLFSRFWLRPVYFFPVCLSTGPPVSRSLRCPFICAHFPAPSSVQLLFWAPIGPFVVPSPSVLPTFHFCPFLALFLVLFESVPLSACCPSFSSCVNLWLA